MDNTFTHYWRHENGQDWKARFNNDRRIWQIAQQGSEDYSSEEFDTLEEAKAYVQENANLLLPLLS
jgi:hypothetical protein